MVKKKKVAAAEQAPAIPPVSQEVTLQSVRPPFSTVENTVHIDGRVLLRHIGKTTVLHNPVRAALKADQHEIFDDILYELRSQGRPIMRVDDYSAFSDGDAQMARLMQINNMPVLQELQGLGLDLAPEDIEAVRGVARVRQKVLEFFKAYAPVYKRGGQRKDEEPLRRTATTVTNPAGHTLTMKQAQKIWERAYKVWGLDQADDGRGHAMYDYDRKKITVHPNHIQVGCQRVTRWQAEQLALEMGWIQ